MSHFQLLNVIGVYGVKIHILREPKLKPVVYGPPPTRAIEDGGGGGIEDDDDIGGIMLVVNDSMEGYTTEQRAGG